MSQIKIAVLSGGPSAEHEVSIQSAENVIKNMDINKFTVLNIKINKEGIWIDQKTGKQFSEKEGLAYLKQHQVDLVFLVLHGEYGEDGTLQKILEEEGLKFTGSGSKASRTAMDKIESARIFESAALKTPSFIFVNFEQWQENQERYLKSTQETFDFPVVVKPTDRGSSVGTTIVKKKEELQKAVAEAFNYSGNVMIQKFIKGRELTCAVIEDKKGEVIPLMPTEIIPSDKYKFFDYNAKYLPGGSLELTPPNLPKKIIKEIQKLAVIAHQSLGCNHVSRADFILSDDTLYILEVNTIPGMTETSLLPQGAKAAGLEISTLLEIIIEAALR